MDKNLVIVESPAKAKTIGKVLGEGFSVKSCFGHIRDLSKKKLGIDHEKGFTPEYIVEPDKKELVRELTKSAKEASMVWLASDDDREGEAIAWHLKETLNIPDGKTRRIAFHEITKDAVLNAIENPREINMNLVMAQQARRVLDRIVGYEVSPILWRKVKPRLSAGRVQSVALRLVVEREREIMAFKSSGYYKVEGLFHPASREKEVFKAELDTRFSSAREAAAFLNDCIGRMYSVAGVEFKTGHKSPAPPFTTSTLQQEASRKLGFSVGQTMTIAQRLYESGLITYMRTDSVQLSKLALGTAKKVIKDTFGAEYCKTRQYATKSKGAQEAHEAIRPTFIENTSIEGTAAERKLYDLVWKRTVASQMADAEVDKTQVQIAVSNSSHRFIANGEVITFDGFLKVYMESTDDEPEKNNENGREGAIPRLQVNDLLNPGMIKATQRYSQHPPRYTEASLVKKLEELGIGRPSTYAPTISTILKRQYVEKVDRQAIKRPYIQMVLSGDKVTEKELSENYGEERGKLTPTDIGILVNDFLSAQFASIVDYGFTAKIEEDFDKIASGALVWNIMLDNFYKPFRQTLDKALETARPNNGERSLGNDPATGKPVHVRLGRFGPMAQIGDNDDPEKRFASLRKGQLLASITLEEALKLFELPREAGHYKDLPVTVSIGRFGPFIKWNGKFVSLGKEDDPYTVTPERIAELIENAQVKESQKHILAFPDDNIFVLKGRFGPYINFNKKNYRIPKGMKPEDLTLEDCRKIIEKHD